MHILVTYEQTALFVIYMICKSHVPDMNTVGKMFISRAQQAPEAHFCKAFVLTHRVYGNLYTSLCEV